MKAARASSLLPLLLSLCGASAESNPKGSDRDGLPAGLWGIDADEIEQWQAYLGKPDATGSFTLPGFNTSQPWSGAEQMDWTIKIAVKADMEVPGTKGDKVVTGGMVWIEPPEDLVKGGGNYTANKEWSPNALYYPSMGTVRTEADEPLTAFFHRDPGDDADADGSCKGILSDECIDFIESTAANDWVRSDPNQPYHLEDDIKCPAVSGSISVNISSPFNFGARAQDDAAMKYDNGWLASFSSPEHDKGNETDYAVHGSQYVPVLFQWQRTEEGSRDKNGLKDFARPDGNLASLICVAVNKATEGKKLPDPGKDYLEAVEDMEAGNGQMQLAPALSLVFAGIGMALLVLP